MEDSAGPDDSDTVVGRLDIDCPPGSHVKQAEVRILDVSAVDRRAKTVARAAVSLRPSERFATFKIDVAEGFRLSPNKYIVTARAVVESSEWDCPRIYGTVAAYPLSLVERGEVTISLVQLYEGERLVTDNAEYQTGGRLGTTYYVVGKQLRPVQYTEIDGLAIAEGCIILGTVEEAEAALKAVRNSPGMLRVETSTLGSVIKGSQYRWPDGMLPFVINDALPDRNRVTEAIQHWESNTAIRFVERTAANAAQYRNYVEFVPGSGCSSSVGMQGGRQLVTLGDGCTRGNCIHEIGHTLGLWHEQSRIDRDAFVEIVWENISAGAEPNFYQQLHDGQDVGSYDFGSIMHYGVTAFSTNDQPTIRVVGDAGGAQIGQRDGLSAGDRATIAAIY